MEKRVVSLLALAALLVASLGLAQTASHAKAARPRASHVMVTPDAVKWGPPPQSWVEGTPPAEFANDPPFQTAVIAGDPTRPGAPYTIRFKAPDGARIPPHWHPGDEHLTILQGAFVLGMGEKFDRSAGRELPTSGYAVVPRGSRHFAWCKGETIVQAHGIGPFKIVWVNPAAGTAKPSN